nr:hypothetical protein [Tanacetum cinerariifolium]
ERGSGSGLLWQAQRSNGTRTALNNGLPCWNCLAALAITNCLKICPTWQLNARSKALVAGRAAATEAWKAGLLSPAAAPAPNALHWPARHRRALYGADSAVRGHALAKRQRTDWFVVSALFLAQHHCAAGVVGGIGAGLAPVPGRRPAQLGALPGGSAATGQHLLRLAAGRLARADAAKPFIALAVYERDHVVVYAARALAGPLKLAGGRLVYLAAPAREYFDVGKARVAKVGRQGRHREKLVFVVAVGRDDVGRVELGGGGGGHCKAHRARLRHWAAGAFLKLKHHRKLAGYAVYYAHAVAGGQPGEGSIGLAGAVGSGEAHTHVGEVEALAGGTQHQGIAVGIEAGEG